MSDVWLVVGLGNPGPAYAGHRHNVGYLVVDELVRRQGSPLRAHKSGRAEVLEGRFAPPGVEGPRVVLVRPRTYMNELGGPVKALAGFYGVPPERIVAIHDELDIPFETMRVKLGGGDNGHNGLRSMRSSLGTGEFHRVRVGVGRPPGPPGPGGLPAVQLLECGAQGAAVRGRPGRGRRRVPGDAGSRAHPAAVQLLTGTAPVRWTRAGPVAPAAAARTSSTRSARDWFLRRMLRAPDSSARSWSSWSIESVTTITSTPARTAGSMSASPSPNAPRSRSTSRTSGGSRSILDTSVSEPGARREVGAGRVETVSCQCHCHDLGEHQLVVDHDDPAGAPRGVGHAGLGFVLGVVDRDVEARGTRGSSGCWAPLRED